MKALLIHPLLYERRPRGHEPDHFKAIEDKLVERGHTMLREDQVNEADVLLFDSDCWNVEDGTSPYNKAVLSYVVEERLPVVWFDYFDHCGDPKSWGRWPGSDDWRDMWTYGPFEKHDWSQFGWRISRPGCNRLLYMMRKMQKSQEYPPWVHPLEYPIFEDFPLVSKEELCARPFDVCGLANLSGPRQKAMDGLRADGRLKLDCEIILHYDRVDYKVWLDRHRQAKFFLEADASLGSERPMRLITIAPMLRVKSDHRIPFPRTDMVHMVEVGDYDGTITRSDVKKILLVLNYPDLLYSIYVNGARHMREYYSMDARSNYVVDLIEKFVGKQKQKEAA